MANRRSGFEVQAREAAAFETADGLLRWIDEAVAVIDARRREVLALAVAGQALTEDETQAIEHDIFALAQEKTECTDAIQRLRAGLARVAELLR